MASLVALLSCLALISGFFVSSDAIDYLVGGSEDSWKIPSSPGTSPLIDWAKKHRFRVGDSLIFKYDGKVDSVLEITKEDYETCNTSKPIKKFTDGNTKFELDRSGRFHFTSGAEQHCFKGQKLIVEVMSAAHFQPPLPNIAAPAPSPGTAPAPAPAKADGLRLRFGLMGLVMVALGAVFGIVLV